MNKPRAGFLLSRHWRDTMPQGTEIRCGWPPTRRCSARCRAFAGIRDVYSCEYQAQVDTLLQGWRQRGCNLCN
ncbi:hypothetical protein WDV93_01785 [Pantoea ananatis]